jgi:DNA modification methylase
MAIAQRVPNFLWPSSQERSPLPLDVFTPVVLVGDCLKILQTIPSDTIDLCMTSPPYWGHRRYESSGLGEEQTAKEYVDKLSKVIFEVRRVLRNSGSLWLNLGDTYDNKGLAGIPWRVSLKLIDEQNWILRNEVIWNKVKGAPDQSKDKLRNLHEHIFHFVKSKNYYYDADAVRSSPRQAKVVNGAVVSATGVSGVRYRRQIECSTALNSEEKISALAELNGILDEIRRGELADFRMIIRGQQRTTHSDASQVSGRAKELERRGFYFLRYHPEGSKPGDVWDVIPEDTQKRGEHFAPYPEDLCRIPILASSPEDGIVLDPFCGTGTTLKVAKQLQRRGLGIDISEKYAALTRERCAFLL